MERPTNRPSTRAWSLAIKSDRHRKSKTPLVTNKQASLGKGHLFDGTMIWAEF